jgi:predicted amidohydrolase YtcJ
MADTILIHGKIATLDPARPEATAVAIKGGLFQAVGDDREIMALRGPNTRVIDLRGRRVIPGLNDSHTHLIRGGLNYNMELRWDGVPSLADALRMLKEQARRTPPPQWVRVVGGWSEFQFAERRMPTLAEINQVAPDTPVFVLHLYCRALLNRAALRALGFTKDTPNPPGGVIERNARGEPTGLLLATPSAFILYSTLARGPKLPVEDQMNSTRHFMRELNRLGITSVIDAGGGGQNYPDDYSVIQELHRQDQLTVRIAYNLFAQQAGSELADYRRWIGMTQPGRGDAWLRMNGAGENLTWSAADFENFLEPRPELASTMDAELENIARLLVENRWPFRIHATYDESIDRFLSVFERVNRERAFEGLRFIIDHAETITPRNIERIKALGGGIAIQHRMAFQGEYFVDRYGERAAATTPPIARMLEMNVPVGAGTDATRVASYNPWVSLYWLMSGKTLGGLRLYPERNRLDRTTALRLWTQGSAWISGEESLKGRIAPGQYADLAVLSADYFSVPDEAIKDIASILTIVGGKPVHATDEFTDLAPPLPPASPDWTPVSAYGGYWQKADAMPESKHGHPPVASCSTGCALHADARGSAWMRPVPTGDRRAFWGALGCSCFAF